MYAGYFLRPLLTRGWILCCPGGTLNVSGLFVDDAAFQTHAFWAMILRTLTLSLGSKLEPHMLAKCYFILLPLQSSLNYLLFSNPYPTPEDWHWIPSFPTSALWYWVMIKAHVWSFKIIIVRSLAHLLLEVCSLLSFPIFCPNPFLTFEVSYLFLSIHHFTKFWNMSLGIIIYAGDWVLDFGQVLLHIFLQFLWRWFVCWQEHEEKQHAVWTPQHGGFWRWKTGWVMLLLFSFLIW